MSTNKEILTMTTINWLHDLDDACDRARQENTLILLDFFSPT